MRGNLKLHLLLLGHIYIFLKRFGYPSYRLYAWFVFVGYVVFFSVQRVWTDDQKSSRPISCTLCWLLLPHLSWPCLSSSDLTLVAHVHTPCIEYYHVCMCLAFGNQVCLGYVCYNMRRQLLHFFYMMMHVKCIYELCTITLIFHSYLHHIRDILLLFNDFW